MVISHFLVKLLACDFGQAMCHAELYELIRELVMSGAMAIWKLGNSTVRAASDPVVSSPLANPPYITEVVVTGDVKLTVFLSAWNGGVSCDRLHVHWCFGMGLHWRGARNQ